MESQTPSPKTFKISGYNQGVQKIITVLFMLLIFYSCKRDIPIQYPPPNLTITAVEPLTGKHGDTIIISGTKFNPDPSEDTVKFNGVTAEVKKASANTLYVIVPITSTGVITVNRISAPGPVFTYIPTIFVSTFAGSGFIDYSVDSISGVAFPGYSDGPVEQAKFNGPSRLYFDKQGNLFVEDYYNACIREISTGVVSTFADYHLIGYQSPTILDPEFGNMGGITFDATGNLYVSEEGLQRIRKISGGMISNFAGTGIIGSQNGPASTAEFYDPGDIVFDLQGNLFVQENNDIRKISPSGVVSSFAGGGTLGVGGFQDGQGTDARFNNPIAITLDVQGNIYVADNGNKRIRKITPSGFVSTFAGSGTEGLQDGSADSARFSLIKGICLDASGNLYVSDISCIRKITPNGFVSTLAGTKTVGFADGPDATAKFYYPGGLAFDAQGNLYVADEGNQRIRKITIQ